jgi:multidrug transporter EmrE-like cation transporter
MWIAFYLIVQLLIAQWADCVLKNRGFILGMTLYSLSAIPAWFLYRDAAFGRVAILWSLGTIVIGVTLGSLYFHEPMSARRWVGLILAVIAICLTN